MGTYAEIAVMVRGWNDADPGAEPDPPIESGSDAGASIIAIAMKTHKRTGGAVPARPVPPVRIGVTSTT